MKLLPNKLECQDEANQPIFTLSTDDGMMAELTLVTPLTLELWDKIAPLIREGLVRMELKDVDSVY
jgi:hypothetical protein